MTNGLLDPTIVAFAFTPVLVSVATVVTLLRRRTGRDVDRGMDVPASLLAWAVCTMPRARREWGAAMLGELAAVPGGMARWCFALSCARAALLLPSGGPALSGERRPMLGLFAVTAPPLALPFIYIAAVIIEAAGAAPAVVVRILVGSTMAALVAGVPLGLASRWRQESLPHPTTWGIASSVGTCAYFLLTMWWLAGGD
ncbi:MAG: hypothetical protein WD733_02295 [Bryobacterales bacterium]